MIVDLADALRCIRPHEPAALITSVDRLSGRQIISGSLGCPVCDARYLVIDGAAVFDAASLDRCRAAPAVLGADEAGVIRVGALLNLTDPAGWVLLEGAASAAGAALHALLDSAVVMLNPPGPIPTGAELSVIYAPVAPFSPGLLRGAAVSQSVDPALADSVVGALRASGRIMGPVTVPVPSGVAELARDAQGWVGTRLAEPTTVPVTLSRARRHDSV
ncbi:MAG: hypothetical protein ACHQTF_06745 [Gemmatimonadales bacterium]